MLVATTVAGTLVVISVVLAAMVVPAAVVPATVLGAVCMATVVPGMVVSGIVMTIVCKTPSAVKGIALPTPVPVKGVGTAAVSVGESLAPVPEYMLPVLLSDAVYVPFLRSAEPPSAPVNAPLSIVPELPSMSLKLVVKRS